MSAIEALLLIVLPVFLVVGAGFAAVKAGAYPEAGVDFLVKFATNIAVPVLLFRALYQLDLAEAVRPLHLLAFYGAATISFAGATLGARLLFGMRPGASVAVGFCALFSNSVLLGLPILERAYGAPALEPAFAIIAFHAAICYLIGILTMEFTRRDGAPLGTALVRTGRAMFRNALTIGMATGLAVNLAGLTPPEPVRAAVELIATAALPVALFGLGGVLTRYRVGPALGPALMVASFSLLVHPALAYLFAHHAFGLPSSFVQASVVIAAMPPGINGYIFAAMYNRAVGIAASTVLLATALSIFSVTGWLALLGGARLG